MVEICNKFGRKFKQSFNNFIEVTEKLKVDESFLLAALTRADIARRKYNNGLITFDDWDVIENDLISRQKTALQSQKDRDLAEANWQLTKGHLKWNCSVLNIDADIPGRWKAMDGRAERPGRRIPPAF